MAISGFGAKVRKWVGDHKKQIGVGCLCVASAAVGAYIGYEFGYANFTENNDREAKELATNLADWITQIVDACGATSCRLTIEKFYERCPGLMAQIADELMKDPTQVNTVHDAFYNDIYVKETMKLVDQLRELGKTEVEA